MSFQLFAGFCRFRCVINNISNMWLSRQTNLNYMLTIFKPHLETRNGVSELFVKYGEIIGISHISLLAAEYVFDTRLEVLGVKKIQVKTQYPTDTPNLWLSRQRNGQYILSEQKPLLKKLRSFDIQDLYIQYGDYANIRHLCNQGVKAFFDIELETFASIQVYLHETA